jgi:hypothetical protein
MPHIAPWCQMHPIVSLRNYCAKECVSSFTCQACLLTELPSCNIDSPINTYRSTRGATLLSNVQTVTGERSSFLAELCQMDYGRVLRGLQIAHGNGGVQKAPCLTSPADSPCHYSPDETQAARPLPFLIYMRCYALSFRPLEVRKISWDTPLNGSYPNLRLPAESFLNPTPFPEGCRATTDACEGNYGVRLRLGHRTALSSSSLSEA